jgi:hypothetical protein
MRKTCKRSGGTSSTSNFDESIKNCILLKEMINIFAVVYLVKLQFVLLLGLLPRKAEGIVPVLMSI